MADFEVPNPTRAAIALIDSVVSRRNRAATSNFSGSFLRNAFFGDPTTPEKQRFYRVMAY